MLAMGYRSRALGWCAATTLVFTSALPQSSAESPCQPLEATSTLPSKTSVDPNAPKNAFAGVFYDNNFSYLTNPEFQGPFLPGDSLKTLNDGKLAIGGEYRSRFHHENNMRGFGLTGVDDHSGFPDCDSSQTINQRKGFGCLASTSMRTPVAKHSLPVRPKRTVAKSKTSSPT